MPQQEAWIIERFGKFSRTLSPGLNVLLPFIEQIKYVQSLKEIALEIPPQSAVTHGTCPGARLLTFVGFFFFLRQCHPPSRRHPLLQGQRPVPRLVRRRERRVCRGAAGPDDHALRDRQARARRHVQGARQAQPGHCPVDGRGHDELGHRVSPLRDPYYEF